MRELSEEYKKGKFIMTKALVVFCDKKSVADNAGVPVVYATSKIGDVDLFALSVLRSFRHLYKEDGVSVFDEVDGGLAVAFGNAELGDNYSKRDFGDYTCEDAGVDVIYKISNFDSDDYLVTIRNEGDEIEEFKMIELLSRSIHTKDKFMVVDYNIGMTDLPTYALIDSGDFDHFLEIAKQKAGMTCVEVDNILDALMVIKTRIMPPEKAVKSVL